MWKLLLTLCVFAVSTHFTNADEKSCGTWYEISILRYDTYETEKSQSCATSFNTFEPDVDIQGVKVVTLNDMCNGIEVPSEAFKNLTHLQHLRLDCVSFSPASNSSKTKQSLQSLKFSRTEWSEGAKNFLDSYLPRRLDIMNVNITILLPSTFPLNSVKSLDLSFNNMRGISEFAFIPFMNLESLRIGHNPLSHLGPRTFRGLGKLKHLDLGYNAITTMDPNAFIEIPGLSGMFLSNNKLTIVPVKAFEKLTNLKHLNLAYNNITNMGVEHLKGLTLNRLQVDLTCNNMTAEHKYVLRILRPAVLKMGGCNDTY